MVVPRPDLERFIGGTTYDLIRDDTATILDVIERRHHFIPRPQAEQSPEFKQIIPYVVMRHDDDYFVLRRLRKQTEARLHDKVSLGIGGHINPDTPTLLGGLRKELEEEVFVETGYALEFAGILNDDTTEVGRVHLGAVFTLEAAERRVRVRETDKMTGEWVASRELAALRDAMETWSQIVYDRLIAESP